MKRLATCFFLFLAFAVLTVTPAQATSHCTFVLGFKTLRDLIGHEIVGECLENETPTTFDDGRTGASQPTTNGELMWVAEDGGLWFVSYADCLWWKPSDGDVEQLQDCGPLPTPTPQPQIIDARLDEVLKVMRTTETGAKTYGWLLESSAQIRFSDTLEDGGGYSRRDNIIYISETMRDHIPGTAALLVHEAVHAILRTEYETDADCYQEEIVAHEWMAQWWLEYYGSEGSGADNYYDFLLKAYLRDDMEKVVREDTVYQEFCGVYPTAPTPTPQPQPTPMSATTLIQRGGCTYAEVYWGLVNRAGGSAWAEGLFKRGGVPVIIELSTEVERVFRVDGLAYPDYKEEATTLSSDFCEQFVISGDYQDAALDVIWPILTDEWKDYINEMYIEARVRVVLGS